MDKNSSVKIIYKDSTYSIEKDEIKKVYRIKFMSEEGKQCIEITEEVSEVFCNSKRINDAIQNEYRRHIEHSELTEITLNKRAKYKVETVEETLINNRSIDEILNDIPGLTDVQKYRYSLNYKGFFLTEIAKMEGCSIKAISKSIKQAEVIIEKFYKKFN